VHVAKERDARADPQVQRAGRRAIDFRGLHHVVREHRRRHRVHVVQVRRQHAVQPVAAVRGCHRVVVLGKSDAGIAMKNDATTT